MIQFIIAIVLLVAMEASHKIVLSDDMHKWSDGILAPATA